MFGTVGVSEVTNAQPVSFQLSYVIDVYVKQYLYQSLQVLFPLTNLDMVLFKIYFLLFG